MAVSRSFCSAAALSVPAGPCGIPSSARVETSFSGSALTCGNGDESSPVPTEPNAARFAGVSGTRISVPSTDPAFSGLFVPMMTARQSRSSCSAHEARSTMSCSSSSGSGPSAFRQSPSARADAGAQTRAHGTMARSPASAMTASRTSAPGIRVIKHDGPHHERPGQQPLPLSLHVLLPQCGPFRDLVDHPRARLPVSHPPPGRASRAQPGCPAPEPARPAGPAPARPPRPCRTPSPRPCGSAPSPR